MATVWTLLLAVLMAGPAAGTSKKLIRIDGDIIFGGIFPMHESEHNGSSSGCGAVKEEKGVQRLEAMLYALDAINNDPTVLPNVTLGAVILDSCSSAPYALEQSMEFVRNFMNPDLSEYKCARGESPQFNPHKPVSGVIGASFSVVSIMVANILRLFKIPQISYASTSTELSDKSRFGFFSRVVPPDNFQAQAMVDVVSALGWKYVSTVAVEGDYGERGIQSFVQLASQNGICVGVSELIHRKAHPDEYDRVVLRLSQRPKARAVVMFVDEDNIRKLLAATIRANLTNHFLYVASDSWGAKNYPVKGQEGAAEGAITILPRKNNILEFDTYYKSLRPNLTECKSLRRNEAQADGGQINCRNIWFREFWEQHHSCSLTPKPGRKPCSGKETLRAYEQEGLVPFVVDAVYAMARAVHELVIDKCGAPFRLCDRVKPAPPGSELLEYIRNLTFRGRQGTEIRFNKDGDAYGSYHIYQYQRNGSKFDYNRVGSWEKSLDFDKGKTMWSRYYPGTMNRPPVSVCSDECPKGHIRNYQDNCCWSCVPCPPNAYANNDTCHPCAVGWAPTLDRADCYKIKPTVLGWDSPWAFVPLAYTCVMVLWTVMTVTVFVRYNSTPVIMASGRELCYVLLLGCTLCFCTPVVLLARPGTETCFVSRIMPGLALSICYSAILTKTNRISRIFNQGARSIRRPACTSPRSQVAICSALVMIQVVVSAVWVYYEPPSTHELHTALHTVMLTCAESTESLMTSLLFNFMLIAMCTLYAFKTRKIPENFNEAKYISFTMYSTCIVWLAFIPIYFGTTDHKVRTCAMSMCVEISATVVLGCLFVPKVYLVIFQPYKNVRQNHIQSGRGMKFAGGASRSERAQTTGLQSSQLQQSQISSATPSGPATASATPSTPADGPASARQQLQVPQLQQQPQTPPPKSPPRDALVLKAADLVQAAPQPAALPKKTPPPVLPRQKTIDKERAPLPPQDLELPEIPQFNHHSPVAATESLASLEGSDRELPCCRATMDLFPGGMEPDEESSNL
ncbi:metabotropic glutamate receptor 2-like [Thrips palmi]|uniref:Metabotropic glutamate receptor 2-like n=1 Tax=Thrips palmi TaxID=161013 RepID=A0A6P8ZMA7_THRPL|nr:metabotropic glutamate receptor 2-like [Thrips palmi]